MENHNFLLENTLSIVIFNGHVTNCQRVNLHFPMVFLGFSQGFPMVFCFKRSHLNNSKVFLESPGIMGGIFQQRYLGSFIMPGIHGVWANEDGIVLTGEARRFGEN